MKFKYYFLILSILFIGCTPQGGFKPQDGECSKIRHKLWAIEDNKYSSYNTKESEDIVRLEIGAKECYRSDSLSEEDYRQYMTLLTKIRSMDTRADDLISSTKQILLQNN